MAHTPTHALDPSPAEPRGHGLRLRSWDPDSDADAEAWLRGCLDPEFQRWNTPLKLWTDLAGARESLRARARDEAAGRSVSFRVTDAESGTTLGHVGVNEISRPMKVARVGYWVLPEARGRGVAVRSLLLASRWGFDELGLHRLELGHAVGHDASCRVAEKCGYPGEGTLREAMFETGRHDRFRDVHLHARIATDAEPPAPASR
ncbi:GNAT family N-acetyltransferase [Streptomyces sp. NPDC000349]|uniref:GNAT family N-acetyltransferase n=1 Tax=unclassified Streptomyces TaxID=2593676 RepID=UPI002781B708|nr:GNAT family N-acetyltransferase [Streptomyces sp. DSM 40167]MDQ0404529.1 RimJ/RimL family protein N-acetyltransferase [Streptomyces sp. DSM 40167]